MSVSIHGYVSERVGVLIYGIGCLVYGMGCYYTRLNVSNQDGVLLYMGCGVSVRDGVLVYGMGCLPDGVFLNGMGMWGVYIMGC